MEGPERIVCCGLCLCMAVAVFSSVSLVYLTALVYMPAKRELQSGLMDHPVTCTTLERLHTDECDWASCFEWCLSQPNFCTQVWSEVRRNGSEIEFHGCTAITDSVCQIPDRMLVEERSCSKDSDCFKLNKRLASRCGFYKKCPESKQIFGCEQETCVSRRETLNCKEDRMCVDLSLQYNCNNGLCHNMSREYVCEYSYTGESYDCREKRNCITITGLFECEAGICTEILWPYDCRRRCVEEISSDVNLIIISGDRTVKGKCSHGVNQLGQNIQLDYSNKEKKKLDRNISGKIAMASCSRLEVDSKTGLITGHDCVNGTRVSKSLLNRNNAHSEEIDWFELRNIFLASTYSQNTRLHIPEIPMTEDLMIYPKAKLFINTEMCVNTLKYECTDFHLTHGSDSRNYSSRATYPCYYNPVQSDYVTVRFDVSATKDLFLLTFTVPVILCIFSCSCLSVSSRILRISDSGQMKLRCRRISNLEIILPVPAAQQQDENEEELDSIVELPASKRRMAVNY